MRTRRIAIAYDCLFPYTTGGGERLYRSYAERIHDRGLDVDYLTTRQWPDTDRPQVDEFRIEAVTGPLRLYDGNGVRRSSAALRFAFGLFRYLLRNRRRYEAIIVSGLPILNVFAARCALLGSGTRVVVDYLEVWGRAQWVEYTGRALGTVAWILQRLAVALTPIATCHSRLTADQLVREGLRSAPLISPGLIDATSPHALTAEAAQPPYVLYAGRHIPDKRVDTLPAAVAVAREDIPDLRLVILGSGPGTPAVRSAVATAGATTWTDLPGFIDQDVLDRLMAEASVLVNPSRREGYGLVVVEATAHGTPVVLVSDPGNAATELVEPGVNGYTAASASPPDLGSAIVRAVRGGAHLRASAREWYESASATRTVERTVDGILRRLGFASPTQRRSVDGPGTIEGRP